MPSKNGKNEVALPQVLLARRLVEVQRGDLDPAA